MNANNIFRFGLLAMLAALFAWPAGAQETVTIPKARLLELERKEKELDALRGELNKSRNEQEQLRRERAKAESEKAQLTRAKEAAEARAVAAQAGPVIAHASPALATLPPLKPGEVVNALDLMNHYRADASGAAQRYGKRRLRVRGVVTGFEKSPFVNPYLIRLQTTERTWPIVCSVDPPAEFKATYPANHGESLVAVTRSEARLTLVRVGQTVEIEATCKGLKEQTLSLTGGRLMVTE